MEVMIASREFKRWSSGFFHLGLIHLKVFVLYFIELSCWVMRSETYVYENFKGSLDLVCCRCNIALRNPFTPSNCNKVYLKPFFLSKLPKQWELGALSIYLLGMGLLME